MIESVRVNADSPRGSAAVPESLAANRKKETDDQPVEMERVYHWLMC